MTDVVGDGRSYIAVVVACDIVGGAYMGTNSPYPIGGLRVESAVSVIVIKISSCLSSSTAVAGDVGCGASLLRGCRC